MSKKALVAVAGLLAVAVLAYFLVGPSKSKKKDVAPKAELTKTAPTAVKAKKATKKSSGKSQRGEMVLLFDDDPVGTLQLEGQVITADDLPVAGATVVIDSRPPRTATTEEDGSFAFDALVARNYDLVARSPEGVAGPLTARLSQSNEPVILQLKAGGTVKVSVFSAATKEPLAGASVELRSVDVQTAKADEQGIASFGPVALDRFEVVAKSPGHAQARTRAIITRPGATTDLRLELRPGAAVSGVVLSHEGEPVEGARAVFCCQSPGALAIALQRPLGR